MKKFLIIFLCFFLFACANNSENISENPENLSTMTGSSEEMENSQNIEEINSEKTEEEIPKRTLVMNGYNVELKEWDKSLGFLTTKGNVVYSDSWDCLNLSGWSEETSYKILQSSGEYGVVLKKWKSCDMPANETYFSIPLTKNIDVLTLVYEHSVTYGQNQTYFNDNKIIVKNLWPVVKVAEWFGEIEEGQLQKEWYTKQWNDWIKIIDIKTVNYPAEKEKLGVDISIKPIIDVNSFVDFTVISDKAYFYTPSGYSTHKFVIQWDVVSAWKTLDKMWDMNMAGDNASDFIYAEYTNKKWVKTTGFLRVRDLEKWKIATNISQKISWPREGRYRIAETNEDYYDGHTIELSSKWSNVFSIEASHFTHLKDEYTHNTRSFSSFGELKKIGNNWQIILTNELDDHCEVIAKFTENSLQIVWDASGCYVQNDKNYIFVWK